MLDEYLNFARDLALKSGEFLMANYDAIDGTDIQFKSRRELVSKADVFSEKTILHAIGKNFPNHSVYSEETEGREGEDSDYRWIVDPLDGTTNFVHGHPFFAISLALEKKGELQLGVVYAPYLDEMFYASRGQGAFLNDEPIRVSGAEELINSIVATGFSYHRDDPRYQNTKNFCNLISQVRGIRRCGSAALDLVYVAAGRYDGFWEIGLQAYDVAAGVVIVEEAGGKVTDFRGGDDYIFGENILATNGIIHELMAESLEPFE